MRNIKLSKYEFSLFSETEKQQLIQPLVKTVISYMAEGYGFTISCSMASDQSNVQKGVVIDELKNNPMLAALRSEYVKLKKESKRKFSIGSPASEYALKLYNEACADE